MYYKKNSLILFLCIFFFFNVFSFVVFSMKFDFDTNTIINSMKVQKQK